MKQHIYRIGIGLLSLFLTIGFMYQEYRKENVSGQIELAFKVKEEEITIWEKEGIFYLFLPSFAELDQVQLMEYSESFQIVSTGDIISQQDNIAQMPLGEIIECKFLHNEEIFQLCVLQSENIPAVFIELESGGVEELKAQKEYRVRGRIDIVESNGNKIDSIGIRTLGGRGNTSFAGYEKKPYSFTLNEAASLLGLPAGENYALISNASDPSLIRNDLVRRLEEAMEMKDSHSGRFVDLYINGEYEGNYYLCDDIEIGIERIDITDMEGMMDILYQNASYEAEEIYETDHSKGRILERNPADITGGYLMEREYIQRFEHEYEMIGSAFITEEKEHFAMKSPQYCSKEQIEYIYQYVNESEKAIMSKNGINPDTGISYMDYIDIDSFVKKYLAEEISKNYDGGVSSSYFYKDSDKNGGKLCAGPGWDYDMSLGNYVEWMEEFSSDPTGISQLAFHTYASPWYNELYQKEEFYTLVKQYYKEKAEPFLEELLAKYLEQYEKWLEASASMNEIRWEAELDANPYYSTREVSFRELKEFLKARKEFLDSVWLEKDADKEEVQP